MCSVHESETGPDGDTWLAITHEEPPISAAYSWAVQPDCGAVVLFSGTARDHSAGRPDVSLLAYEAYEERLIERFEGLVVEIRAQWPEVRRVVVMHRVGEVPIGESTVIVVASSPHRDVAFEAARYGIDRLKATAPVWKREVWSEGESWGLDAREIEDLGVPAPGGSR
ncbi:MAG: molybdenum cofactor biosynthesis protein MoaE [Acidimicrobiales bacterium]|nr:molybdenum cofactor biosynthesis protein MoaE [Acidimicrobiales bacterium]RZV44023.1 MAG: molybdenum cofactor biosynthesis protein MoaE [Acidimicrobiales bacterium]